MLKRIHALRPIGERRLYFQSLLYNMRGFWSLHTLSSTHTLPHPVAPGRTTSPARFPTPRCPPGRPGPGARLSTSVPAPEPRCSIHRRRKTAYFQSLLYNMRCFCLLHTLPSTHTFTPSCLGRQDHVAGAVTSTNSSIACPGCEVRDIALAIVTQQPGTVGDWNLVHARPVHRILDHLDEGVSGCWRSVRRVESNRMRKLPGAGSR